MHVKVVNSYAAYEISSVAMSNISQRNLHSQHIAMNNDHLNASLLVPVSVVNSVLFLTLGKVS